MRVLEKRSHGKDQRHVQAYYAEQDDQVEMEDVCDAESKAEDYAEDASPACKWSVMNIPAALRYVYHMERQYGKGGDGSEQMLGSPEDKSNRNAQTYHCPYIPVRKKWSDTHPVY